MDNHSKNNDSASSQQPEYVDFFNANTGKIVRLSVVRRLCYFFNPVTGECTGCADATRWPEGCCPANGTFELPPNIPGHRPQWDFEKRKWYALPLLPGEKLRS